MTSRPKRVLLTQDPFRGDAFGLSSNGFLYEWLDGLFRLPFEAAGWEVELVVPRDAGGRFDARGIADRLALPPTAQGWACVHAGRVLEPDALFEALPDADMVVGLELPPWIVAGAARRGIPFLSLAPAPYRFLPDLLASVHTSIPVLASRLARHHQDATLLRPAAAIFAAGRRRRLGAPLLSRGRFGVLAGQMAVDAALVRDGCIETPADHEAAILALVGRVDRLFVCPHPYEPDRGPLLDLADRLPNAIVSTLPVYDLIVSPHVTDVVALSSSVLAEAALFGKSAHRLITCDRDMALLAYAVAPPVLCGLADLLAGLDSFLSGCEPQGTPMSVGGSFRASLGSDWGLADAALPELLLPGVPLSGEAPGPTGASFADGWHPADGFCTWSRQDAARLPLRIGQADPVLLRITLHSLPAAGGAGQTVTVGVGDGPRASHRFDQPGEATLELALDPADLLGGTLLDLSVQTDRLDTPQALGLGPDDRLLGTGLRRIVLEQRPG